MPRRQIICVINCNNHIIWKQGKPKIANRGYRSTKKTSEVVFWGSTLSCQPETPWRKNGHSFEIAGKRSWTEVEAKGSGVRPPYTGPPRKVDVPHQGTWRKTPRPGPPAPASFPKARSMLPADRAQQEKKIGRISVFLSSLGGRGRPEGLGGRGARRPPSPPPKPIAQRGCPILCSLPAGDPRTVWPAAPGIPSLLEHRTEGLLPPSLENPSSFKTRGPIHTMQCLPVGYKFYSKTTYIYIYCNILCNIAGSSSRHQSSVYRVYLCPRFLRSTSRQIRAEVSVKQNHRQIPAKTCKNNDQT